MTLLRIFILHYILEVIHLLCSRFEPMMNLFDQISNVILNAICEVLIVSKSADWSIPLFGMKYLWIHDRWDLMFCTIMFYSKNTLSVSVFKSWWIYLHTLLGLFHLWKSLFCWCPLLCKSKYLTLNSCEMCPIICHEPKSYIYTLLMIVN